MRIFRWNLRFRGCVRRFNLVTLFGGARRLAPATFAAFFGIAVSLLAWLAVAAWEDRFERQAFASRATNVAHILQAGLDEYLSKLSAFRAFFDASNDGVSREEFNVFTRELQDERKAILSFSWIPRVGREERAAHELQGRREGVPGYQIKAVGADGAMQRAPEHHEYFPVFYSNEILSSKSYGIDLHDGGVRQQPLERARHGDVPATSGNFRLQSGTGDRNGFFVVLPVYRQDRAHNTLDQRRRNLVGFVQSVFQFTVMVETILTDVEAPPGVLLFEADASPADVPIYAHVPNDGRAGAMSKAAAMAATASWVGDLAVGDRHWQIVVIPRAGAPAGITLDRAFIVLAAGLAITGLVVAYILGSILHVRRLETLAGTDALTGLANRRAFIDQLGQAFAGVARVDRPFAVHFLDIDEFKDVNDTQGHAAGDMLLRDVARRLTTLVRANDLVARFGGDEFAVLQTDAGDFAAAGALAGKIVKGLTAPYVIDGIELRVSASVGTARLSSLADDPKTIMMQADLALYRAKGDGGNCFRFHGGELDQQVHLRVNLAEELRKAIANEELELLYQTQVEIRSGRIVGLEALVRWAHPARGLILPSIFVPIAERTGNILALGQWVLARACRQLHEWEGQGVSVPRLAINVSGTQVRRSSEFEHDVAETFALWHTRRHAIEFELTESVLMEVTQRQSNAFERLRELGVTIAIDDFGTGYSSLKYLTTYPVNRLKIAGELVAGVTTDSRSAVVVRSAIRLAHDLGIEVIAEGVERAEQARFLLEAGCEYAQGYHYSRPMPAGDIALLLGGGRGSAEASSPRPSSSAA